MQAVETTIDSTTLLSFEAAQKKTRAGKGVSQLGQQSQQSVPPLVIRNEYGLNLDLEVKTKTMTLH